ncbi:MAG: mannitol dehydrogenase family protein [Sphingobium sp.]|nr:mannitol dehydrogenase family protein [Sphingobium sp.]
MTNRLSTDTLPLLNGRIATPSYDRAALAEGVVHLGLGAFNRAHQAAYLDAIAKQGDPRWGIVGVSLRSPGVRDRLASQDGLYTLLVRDGAGEEAQVIGALKRMLVAPEDPEAVVAAMAQPSVHLVTLTVTEKGYALDRAKGGLDTSNPDIAADLASLAAPRTAPGFIVAALNRRRVAGLPAFTAASCDNLPHNGALLRDAVLAMARAHDAKLADWIETNGAFPASMVDRIVPATTQERIDRFATDYGVLDDGLIETEPFTQWVLERNFVGEMPDLASVGVTYTAAVAPWEDAKLRMLNGAHSTLAYLGGLAGIAYVHEFVADARRRALIERLWDESATTLNPPPELDLARYRADLLHRFANPRLQHKTYQIAMDGSQKLPQRIVAPLRARLEAGLPSPMLELAVAAWMAWQRGVDAQGNRFTVDDPLAAKTALAWANSASPDDACARLLAMIEIFGNVAQQWPDLAWRTAKTLRRLIEDGPAALIADMTGAEA